MHRAEVPVAKPKNKKAGRQKLQVDTARERLGALARFLSQEAKQVPLASDRELLRWGADSLHAFLIGKALSLNHAFGMVRGQGNPGKAGKWAERAAEADRENLSAPKVASRFGLADIKSVREGLARGRRDNAAAEIARIAAELDDRLDRAAGGDDADRAARVRKFNRKHKIKSGSGSKVRGSN
jgi:hypothetical protein